jgi:5,10-methylenetetrahydromethanopterin reductase
MNTGILLLGEHHHRRLAGLASLIEELGFQTLWYADEKFYRDPWVGLAVAATATSNIRLGTCVTEPYTRHPALIAMAIGSLDEVSGGRAILGLGAGGPGFPALGVERRNPPQAMREAVGLVRQLLDGQAVELRGQLFSFKGSLNFRPSRRIPIYVASRGPRTLKAAGEVADGVIVAPYASPQGVKAALDRIYEGLRAKGRAREDISVVSRVDVAFHDDADLAREAVKYWIALPLWGSYPNWSYLDPLPKAAISNQLVEIVAQRDYSLIAQAARYIPDTLVDHLAVAGTGPQVVAQLRQLVAAGIDELIIHPVPVGHLSLEETLGLLSHKILPEVFKP